MAEYFGIIRFLQKIQQIVKIAHIQSFLQHSSFLFTLSL